jgi:hypothetical protein
MDRYPDARFELEAGLVAPENLHSISSHSAHGSSSLSGVFVESTNDAWANRQHAAKFRETAVERAFGAGGMGHLIDHP